MKSYEFCREILEPPQNRFRVFAETTVTRYIKYIEYVSSQKNVTKSYKNQKLSALKHVCELMMLSLTGKN
jgi:hypothetical protein